MTEAPVQPLSLEPVPTATEVTTAALRGSAVVAARGLALRVLTFVSTLVLARILTPRDFGALAIGVALTSVATMLSNGGIGAALIQQRAEPTHRDLQALQGFQLAATIVAVTLVGVVSLWVDQLGVVPFIVMLSMPISSLQTPGAIILERRLLYGPRVLVEIVETLTYVVVAVAAAAAGAGVLGVAAAYPVKAIAGALVMHRVSPVGLTRPSAEWRLVRRLLRFGVQFQATGVVGLARDQGTNFGVAAVGGLPLLGVFSLALRVIQIPVLLFESLWRVSFPAMSRLLSTDADADAVVSRCIRVAASCTALLLVGLAGASRSLIPVVFGQRWAAATPLLPWAWFSLMIGAPLSVALTGYLYARGNARVVLWAATAQAVLTLAIGLPLLPALGLTSMGIAMLVATVADIVILTRGSGPVIQSRLWSELGVPTALAVAAGAAGWSVSLAFPVNWTGCLSGAAVAEVTLLCAMWAVDGQRLRELVRIGRRAVAPSVRAGA